MVYALSEASWVKEQTYKVKFEKPNTKFETLLPNGPNLQTYPPPSWNKNWNIGKTAFR